MEWVQWLGILFGGGSIGYLLVDRFLRTPEQKEGAVAQLISQVTDAFSKTLDALMEHSTGVIEKMKKDEEYSEARYRDLEARYEKLEARFDYEEEDHELLKNIVGKAVNCPLLKDKKNDDCPVIRENQKRMNQKCKNCGKPHKTEQV